MRAGITNRTPARRRLAMTASLVLGAGLVLAACASTPSASTTSSTSRPPGSATSRGATTTSPPATTAAELVDRAVTSTDAAKTMHVTMSSTMNGGAGIGTIAITADGDVALDPMRMALTLQMGMGSSGLTINMNERLVDGNLYMTFPLLSQSIPGKSWVQVPAGQAISGLDPSSTSPASALALLAAGGGSAQRVGTATVDGVPTTEYAMSINAAKAKADASTNMKVLSPSLRQAFTSELKSMGLGTTEVHAWIDGNGLIRKIDETVPLTIPNSSLGVSNAAGSTNMTESVQLVYSSFGEPVTVALPPPQSIATWAQFNQAMSTSGGSATG